MEENTRKAFGNAMVAANAGRPDIVALDGDVSDSTFTEEFKRA